MRKITFIAILFSTVIAMAETETHTYTRDEIFSHPVSPERSPVKYYAEVDLNGDDINDLLFSESISLGGTGGLVYDIYLGVGENKFKRAYFEDSTQRKSSIQASMMALEIEKESKTRRLWIYSHGSARSGSIAYLYFGRKGNLNISRHITICSSVEGNELGDKILDTIFSESIKTTKIEVPKYGIPISQLSLPGKPSN